MLIVILLLSLVLRLINLNQSLWLDEVLQAQAVIKFSLERLFTEYLVTDFNPPLSYLVSFTWGKLAGYSEIALRLPSVFFGVATVWFSYLIAKIIFPKKPSMAIISALLLATAPLHVYYSQEARAYSLAAFAVTGSIWALISFIKTNRHLFYYFLFLAIAVYSHYLAWFILPAQMAMVFILKRVKVKQILWTQLLVLLIWLPWLPSFISQLKIGLAASSGNPQWAQVVGGVSLKNLSLIPIKFLIGRISIDNNYMFAVILFLPILVSIWLFITAFKNVLKNKLATTVIFCWLGIPLVLITLVSIKVPVLAYFRLLFLLPAFYLGLVLGIKSIFRSWQIPVVVFLLAINLISTGVYLFNPNFHRENWQKLSQTLIEKNPNQDPVVAISVVSAPLNHYYPYQNIVNYDDIDSVLGESQLWLAPYAEPIFDPQQLVRQKIIAAGYQEKYQQHFRGDLTLIQYIK